MSPNICFSLSETTSCPKSQNYRVTNLIATRRNERSGNHDLHHVVPASKKWMNRLFPFGTNDPVGEDRIGKHGWIRTISPPRGVTFLVWDTVVRARFEKLFRYDASEPAGYNERCMDLPRFFCKKSGGNNAILRGWPARPPTRMHLNAWSFDVLTISLFHAVTGGPRSEKWVST